jgi:hypothetical protein
MPLNPMVMTLDQFNLMRTNFQQHYFLSGCNSDFGGQDLQITWSSFYTVVQNFISTYSVAANTVAFRFVLCYDSANNELYLRMQICTMTSTGSGTFSLNATPCAWYIIDDGTINSTTDTDLYDQNYLNNFYYCASGTCDPSTLVNLASDTGDTIFVRNLVFPWSQEIAHLFTDNGSPSTGYIDFAAGSLAGTSSAVAYPHALVIYLCDSTGTPLLDNVTYSQQFKMKAGDMGTLCPANCNVYILPK